MNFELLPHAELSDDELLAEVARLAASERAATVRLIAALAEVDSRRLYLGQGCSSLFVYCTTLLRLSEHAAYGRIEAARAARRFPVLLEMLARGELTLTSLCLVAPHLTEPNHLDVLVRVRHRCKREVEDIVASLRPKPDVPTLIRKVPRRASATEPEAGVLSAPPQTRPEGDPNRGVPNVSAPTPQVETRATAPPAAVRPLAPERYKLLVTIAEAAARAGSVAALASIR